LFVGLSVCLSVRASFPSEANEAITYNIITSPEKHAAGRCNFVSYGVRLNTKSHNTTYCIHYF